MDCIHRNGEIIGYTVRYGEEVGGQRHRYPPGDSSGGMITLSGLTKQTVYTVEVAARTSGGTGVYSQSQNIETLDSEQLVFLIVCLLTLGMHGLRYRLSVCLLPRFLRLRATRTKE